MMSRPRNCLRADRAITEGEYPWVNSGDRAYQADSETYITGRVKDIIIKGGRNLYPHEVEELASRVDGITQRLCGGVWIERRENRHGETGDCGGIAGRKSREEAGGGVSGDQ